jgi:hypothetical protein
MTDAEMEAARAEYDALPGTPADLTRVTDISAVHGQQPDIIAKWIGPMADGLREQGYQWFRCTAPDDDEDHVYFEAWRERPYKQGPLNRAAAESFPPSQSEQLSK